MRSAFGTLSKCPFIVGLLTWFTHDSIVNEGALSYAFALICSVMAPKELPLLTDVCTEGFQLAGGAYWMCLKHHSAARR